MRILTPSGYRDIVDCQVGDEVVAFDIATGAPIVNQIELIQPVDYAEWCRFWQPADEVPPFTFYRINGSYTLFREQSIWRNGTFVCHARDLVVGDTIYDDADHPIVIASIEEAGPVENFVRFSDESQSWLFRPNELLGDRPASEIAPGDSFPYAGGVFQADRVEVVKGWYRFTISGDHSYIVDGITLHNASRFWVLGTGTWDGVTTTNWSATTGGTGGQSVPGAADDVTFDGSSGGGTVTVNTTVTINSLTFGAYTGTLDFSVNNNNVTLGRVSGTGSATRTFRMGNGTWTINPIAFTTPWDLFNTAGLTFSANSSTILYNGTIPGNINPSNLAALAYNAISFICSTPGAYLGIGGSGALSIVTLTINGLAVITCSSGLTITNLNMSNGATFSLGAGTTTTITNPFTLTGSSSKLLVLRSPGNTRSTVSTPLGCTGSWCAVSGVNFTNNVIFTNSYDTGANSGATFTLPPTHSPTLQLGI